MNNPFRKAFSWYFSKKTLPYWGVLAIDCCILTAASLIAIAFNHKLSPSTLLTQSIILTVGLYLCLFILSFRLFRTYMGIMRFSSFVDLQRLGFALLVGTAFIMVCQYLIVPNRLLFQFWTSDIVLLYLIALTGMWATRIIVKRIFDNTVCKTTEQSSVFIYGVMTGGVAIAKSIRRPESRFNLKGFVSDADELNNHMLMGVPVFGNDSTLVDEMRKAHASALLVSPRKSDALRNNTEMVNSLLDAGIKIFVMPTPQEWDGHSDISISQLQEIRIEDLLPRQEIEVDMVAIGRMLHGKRILVTGAAGSIGSEISRQIASFGPETLVLIDQAETPLHDIRLMMSKQFSAIDAPTIVTDICNQKHMEMIFERYRPEYVFHAAAYKHVPMMEDNPVESVVNNVKGTKIIADLSVKYGTRKFVMVSTDKAVNPTNVMGCSKRICEIYVQSLDKAIVEGKVDGQTRFVTTRFGNVLGSNGSVIPLFQQQIKMGGPVTVTHPDIIRFFMLIPEACKLVLEAGSMGNGGEIFVFDMGKPVKIADLAKRMIQLSGAKNVEIKFTGLRDGEKLYEEVLNDQEITLPTFHQKIKIAKVREYDYHNITEDINCLVADADKCDDMLTVSEMKNIVPEFISKHSKYEVLDNTHPTQQVYV